MTVISTGAEQSPRERGQDPEHALHASDDGQGDFVELGDDGEPASIRAEDLSAVDPDESCEM